ncbi:hypothetical protein ACLOJK_018795, partial [Asimina triloba]
TPNHMRMCIDFSEPPEHRIWCSIILLKGEAMAAGDPSSSSSSTAAMKNSFDDGGRQQPIGSNRTEQRVAKSDQQRSTASMSDLKSTHRRSFNGGSSPAKRMVTKSRLGIRPCSTRFATQNQQTHLPSSSSSYLFSSQLLTGSKWVSPEETNPKSHHHPSVDRKPIKTGSIRLRLTLH